MVNDKPPESAGSLAYVLWVAEWHGIRNPDPRLAIKQDMGVYGDDVDDFALKLAERYGDWVGRWPWERFVELNEGVPITWPFRVIWQIASWPFRGQFLYPDPHERLTLGHIAKVLEKGEWVDP